MCGSACIKISDCCWGVGLSGSGIGAPRGGWPLLASREWKLKQFGAPACLLRFIRFDRASPPADTLDQAQFVRRSTALSRERTMRLSAVLTFAGMVALASSGAAFAGDPASCKMVRFSDVGWTDITDTTAIANEIFKGLGYTPNITVLGSRDLRFDEEQGHRRVSRQL